MSATSSSTLMCLACRKLPVMPMDGDARLQHRVVIRLLGELHQRLVGLLIDDEIDGHAAPGGAAHRDQERLARDHVGRSQHHPRSCAVHERDHHRLGRALVVAGSARDHFGEALRRDGRLRRRQVVGFGRQVARLEIPVAQQHRMQMAHERPFRAHQHLLVDHPSVGVRADDVLRAEERAGSVDDDDLAVVAQVEARGVRTPQAQGHHGNDLRTRGAQSRPEALQASARADRIHQHAHRDAAHRGLPQRSATRRPTSSSSKM